jgi:hypothetical protein
MNSYGQDPTIKALLDLNGQILVLDAKGSYLVRFSVQSVERSPERPHGLNYSLTLHGPQGQRLIGFDNAHSIRRSRGPGGKHSGPADHRHRIDEARPYRYKDAATLLADFWAEVDVYLKEKGVSLK